MARALAASGEGFPLFEGETGASDSADVEHWISVYAAMIGFCRAVLAEYEAVDSIDRRALRRRIDHYERRRAFWARQARSARPG
jgi:hypothetical protein